MKNVYANFEDIKEIRPEFDKLHVQVQKLDEYNPKLQDMLGKEKEKLHEKSSFLFIDLGNVFNSLEKAALELKHIMLDADAVLYKEDRQLTKFAKQIKNLQDTSLRQELLVKVNGVKEEMMSLIRRLFESAKASEHDLFLEGKKTIQRTPLSKDIQRLSVHIDEVGRVLTNLDIDDIDQITENAEKQLDYLNKVELDVILSIKNLEKHLIDIKNKIYLLDGDLKDKVRQRIINAERTFDKAKETITRSAEKLLLQIKII